MDFQPPSMAKNLFLTVMHKNLINGDRAQIRFGGRIVPPSPRNITRLLQSLTLTQITEQIHHPAQQIKAERSRKQSLHPRCFHIFSFIIVTAHVMEPLLFLSQSSRQSPKLNATCIFYLGVRGDCYCDNDECDWILSVHCQQEDSGGTVHQHNITIHHHSPLVLRTQPVWLSRSISNI